MCHRGQCGQCADSAPCGRQPPGQVCEFSFVTRGSTSVGLPLHRGQGHQEWAQFQAVFVGSPLVPVGLQPAAGLCFLTAQPADLKLQSRCRHIRPGATYSLPTMRGSGPCSTSPARPVSCARDLALFCFTGPTRTDTGAHSNYGKVEAAVQMSAEANRVRIG